MRPLTRRDLHHAMHAGQLIVRVVAVVAGAWIHAVATAICRWIGACCKWEWLGLGLPQIFWQPAHRPDGVGLAPLESRA